MRIMLQVDSRGGCTPLWVPARSTGTSAGQAGLMRHHASSAGGRSGAGQNTLLQCDRHTFCSLAKLQMAQQHEGLPQPSTGPIGMGVLGGFAFLAVPAAPLVMDMLKPCVAWHKPG